MPVTPCCCRSPRASADVNDAIRRLCAGRTVWSGEALAELARLRAEWRAAVARETELAA